MSFSLHSGTQEDADFLNSKIDAFNKAQLHFMGHQLERPLRYVMKDGETIIAGIDALFYLESILYIHVFFIEEAYRKQRLGTLLLEKVEAEARVLGGTLCHLDTFDFQAKDFYLKHGYEVFGILEDCPEGHKRFYMKRKL